MRKLLLPLLAVLFLTACEKEGTNDLRSDEIEFSKDSSTKAKEEKVEVCHYDAENDTYHVINISAKALEAHLAHGDYEGDCSTSCVDGELEVTLPDGTIIYVHPNDQNSGFPQFDGILWSDIGTDIPDLTNYNTTASALGDFDGEANTDKIYVELTTSQGVSYSYAAKRCKELSTETGCDWYLPALGELNAIYDEYGNTEAKRTENNFDGSFYWSSTESGVNTGWIQVFVNGNQGNVGKINFGSCRCVRR